jgi:hypothetical protein
LNAAMKPWSRWLTYAVLLTLWVSGAAWLWLQYWAPPAGFEGHPAQPLWMKLHGLAAMVFLLLLGALLPTHVKPGWAKKKQRLSGTLLLALLGILIASGWGLYYLSEEQGRQAVSLMHWVLGLGMPAFSIYHFVRRKK